MNNMIDILQKTGLRLTLCAFALGLAAQASAQTDGDFDEEEQTEKAPKKRVAKPAPKYPMVEVRGVVFDEATHKPLAGVQLQSLGNKRYTAMTDDDGSFTIKVPEFVTSLYVHSPNYLSQQVAIKAGDAGQHVEIRLLSEKFKPMYEDATPITARGSFKAKGDDVTIENEIGANLGADVRTVSRSAAPGIGASMFIRGINSINANGQPLVLIDGVEQDMQYGRTSLHLGQFNNILANISPEDIEKVTVLKNATALYGARGANGVILIETKRGHSMATRIDANISAGVSLIPKLPTMMNASQYRTYAAEMLGTIEANTKLTGSSKIDYNFLNDDPNGYHYHTYHNNTDWTDYAYRNALTQNYSINVQGGDDVGMYNLSVGYLKAESTAEKNDFDRINVRFNTDISITKRLSTKFDISFARTNNNVFDDGIAEDLTTGVVTSPTFLSLIKSPIVSPYQYSKVTNSYTSLLSGYDEIFGQLGDEYSLANPVAILENGSGDNKNKAENTYFNIRIVPTIDLGKNFKLTEDLNYTLNRNAQRYHRPYEGVPSFELEGVGTVTSMAASLYSKEINFVSDTRLDWGKNLGAHTVSAYAGFRYNYFTYDDSDLSTQYNTATSDKNPTLAISPYPDVKGANDVWKYMMWYANADYNYMNRYFVTLSLAAEANSRFGENATGLKLAGVKWALYPSVQLGWVLTNESWFPKHSGIDYLRVNAGYDVSGNADISNYAAFTGYTSVRFNQKFAGLQLTNIGNDEIEAERTHKLNVGLQANMLRNRLSVGFDYFYHKTNNLLTLKTFDNPIAGIRNYWCNGGELENQGFEASVGFKPVATKDWTVEVGATMGHYKNKVKKLPEGSIVSSAYGEDNIITAVGQSAGMFYGYETDGVFSTDAEAKAAGNGGYLYMVNEAGNHVDFKAGDVHFVDRNGDGVIDEGDKTVIGDPNPDIYGNITASVSWKNLTLGVGFNYSLGNDIYNYQRSVLNSGSTLYNQQVAETGRWHYEGQQAELPRAYYGDPKGNNRFSDRWLEDGSYLRLKTLTLTYRVPVPGTWTWLQGLSVWAEAQNLFTLTKYVGSDPEVSASNSVLYQGIDCGNLALGRTFSLGIKINL